MKLCECWSTNVLELVHRLDRDTSGILLIAKKRSALHIYISNYVKNDTKKLFSFSKRGQWQPHCQVVKAPLLKNELSIGERFVKVSENGKPSETHFAINEKYQNATLVKASPVTGRTHQIRVHAQHAGHPIAMDSKYGDKHFDQRMSLFGLNRLFLHAHSIYLEHPKTGNATLTGSIRKKN